LAFSALAFAGCGGNDDEDAGTTADTGTEFEDVSLDRGETVIPGQNVGDVDLTSLPLGDDNVSDEPGVGDLYLCPEFPVGDEGPTIDGPWIKGRTYDLESKAFVSGDVKWPEAVFDTGLEGTSDRRLRGNNLPTDHTTGVFPVTEDDPEAFEYDPNPNPIEPSDYQITVPANPEPAEEPQCVGGESGFLLSGVVLNSPVDAAGRDAVAHEVQDHCFGHPNPTGYHYHSLSPCIPDRGTAHSRLVGYALDGFGIFGFRGPGGEVMTNRDLDACHGHNHEIQWDGERREMYHYHATWEFPYVVGCFKGSSEFEGPVLGGEGVIPP
jgi:hypothetical protein